MIKEFYTAILPNYYFYKIFCTLPISISRSGLTTSLSHVIYSVIWIIVYAYCTKNAFPTSDVSFMDENFVSQLGGNVEIISTISIVIINAITNLFTRYKIIHLFQTLEDIYKSLNNLGAKIIVKKTYLYAPLIFVIVEFIQVTLWDHIVFLKDESFMYVLINYTTILLNSSCRFVFVQIACLICANYRALNKRINTFMHSDVLRIYQEQNILNVVSFIKQASETHAYISTAIKLVNKIFGLVILLCIGLSLFIMTSQLNECYITFVEPWDEEQEESLMSILTAVNWAGLQFIETAIIVYVCSTAMKEVFIDNLYYTI